MKRSTFYLITSSTLVLGVLYLFRNDLIPGRWIKQKPGSNLVIEPTFYDLARATGTDKVRKHRYECLYENELAPYRRQRNLKFLEIGLGCTMAYGPGRSFKVWASYFEDVQTYFFEFNQTCGEAWAHKIMNEEPIVKGKARPPIMIYGDQANRQTLQQMVNEHGPWDIIVDDGGHAMNQQITSFEQLWPHIAPGGTYFIEDLETSFNRGYSGTNSGLTEGDKKTAISFVSEVLAASIAKKGLGVKLERLTCCDEICAFVAKS